MNVLFTSLPCPSGGETTPTPTSAPTNVGAQDSKWTPNGWKCFVAGTMCNKAPFVRKRNTTTATYVETIELLRFLTTNGTALREKLNNITYLNTLELEDYNEESNRTANVLLPMIKERQAEMAHVIEELDVAFLLVGAVSAIMVKAGYLLRNTGLVQLPHMQSTLIMSLWDTSLVVLSWWIVGNGWTFGSDKYPEQTENGLVGKSHYLDYMSELNGKEHAADWASYVYFLGLCCQCVAIVSGAVMERATLRGYLVSVIFIASLLFPSVAHSLWNKAGWASADRIENVVFDCGVIDHGGSAAVHMVGGICALSAVIVIGPRSWRYRPATSKMVAATHSSMAMNVFGCYLVAIFSVGAAFYSVQRGSDEMQAALYAGTNTGVASAAGAVVALGLGYLKDRAMTRDGPGERIFSIELLAGGVLSGLASIAAGAPYYDHVIAALVGAIGAVVYVAFGLLVNGLKIDDCSSSVAIHAFGGAWGMLAVGLFVNPQMYHNHYVTLFDEYGAEMEAHGESSAGINAHDRDMRCAGIFYPRAMNEGAQLQAQLLFVVGTFFSVGPASLLLFYLIKRTMKIRVSSQKETDGIDRHDFGGLTSGTPMELRMVTTDQSWVHAPLFEQVRAAQDGDTTEFSQNMRKLVLSRLRAKTPGGGGGGGGGSGGGGAVSASFASFDERELKKYIVKDGVLWRKTRFPAKCNAAEEEASQRPFMWVMYVPRDATALQFQACLYELQKNSAEKIDDDVTTTDTISVPMLELRKRYWWGDPYKIYEQEAKGTESLEWAEMEDMLATAAKRYRDASFRAKNGGQNDLFEEVPYSRRVDVGAYVEDRRAKKNEDGSAGVVWKPTGHFKPSTTTGANLARLVVRKRGGPWELEGLPDESAPGFMQAWDDTRFDPDDEDHPQYNPEEEDERLNRVVERRANVHMFESPYLGSHGGTVRPMDLSKASDLFRS
jgi:Amt family ammonium transporter